MKMKCSFFVLWMFLLIPLITYAGENEKTSRKHRSVFRVIAQSEHDVERCPMACSVTVSDVDNAIQICFMGILSDVTVSVTDNEGNIVLHELLSDIQDGQICSFDNMENYPYTVEMTSPKFDMLGEIIEEIIY